MPLCLTLHTWLVYWGSGNQSQVFKVLRTAELSLQAPPLIIHLSVLQMKGRLGKHSVAEPHSQPHSRLTTVTHSHCVPQLRSHNLLLCTHLQIYLQSLGSILTPLGLLDQAYSTQTHPVVPLFPSPHSGERKRFLYFCSHDKLGARWAPSAWPPQGS